MLNVVGLGQRALDLLFPPRCVGCGAGGAVLCAACRASLRAPEPPLCCRCGTPLASTLGAALPESGGGDGWAEGTLCASCARGGFPAPLAGIRVAVVYEGAAREAVLALKYRGQRRLAAPLGDLLAEASRGGVIVADVVVPVPLHRARGRARGRVRGYNQADLLAGRVAGRLRLPLRRDALRRPRATRPQTQLAPAERRANVAGAFALASPRAASALAGKRVLLIDDVTTTGSTLEAAAVALAAAHPAAVWGLAFARPDRPQPPAGA